VANLAIRVVLVFSAVWVVYRMADLFGVWLLDRAERTATKLDDQLVPLVTKALKLFVVAVGAVFILQNLDVDVAGLLAGLGLGGLAFALAAKDTVANLFGSATIFADRPFQVGDWVVIGGAEGTVEQVGFRSTRIRTFYNSLVSIPNAKVGESLIDNYGARRYRRYKAHLDITYDTPTEKIQAFVEGVRAAVQANPHMRKDYYHVYFNDFGPASLKILVYVFFEVPTWADELRERHNFLLEIMRVAEELGVEFAFPTQTLHVASQAPAAMPAEPRVLSETELIAAVEAFGPGGAKARPAGPRLTGGFVAGE
jgi:MscS family membrane protein